MWSNGEAREAAAATFDSPATAGLPWFRAHPALAVAVIASSSVAVLALQMLDMRASDAVALLYVMPVGLAAVSFGLWAGLAAAATAYLAFGIFALAANSDNVGPDGWLWRAAALFLLGALLGRASDQTARAAQAALAHQRERLIAEEQIRRYCEGIELSDSILQHVAAAKWLIERGDHVEAAELLSKALNAGQEMITGLLPPVVSSSQVTRRSPPSRAAARPPTIPSL